ncbi:twitching motility protein PilT [Halonotius roseus]|uniref:Twitching motility protein PilT n=1 Tax=Halonotius roseus TaxID=2511997 RepID=A0A544QRZ7_9EURY|nr:twitching motility protein PilT [Halonotius roseus]
MVVLGLDTNALMMPVECDIRVFDELDRLFGPAAELVVPSAVLDELDSLAGGHSEAATAASVGKDLAGRCRVVETNVSYADDAIVELATDGELDYVVTNDAPLRDRLRSHGVHVVSRQGETTLGIRSP